MTDGVVRISRVTKGKKGKCVTVITGLTLDAPDIKTLVKTLKTKCGSGGRVKDGALEIQGDHRRAIMDTLAAMGHRVKLAGG